MKSYAEFAKFYDVAMGDMSDKVEFLMKLLQENAPGACNILEFACGTGTILEGLSPSYVVAGLDLSEEMTAIAKKKLREADIRVGDMAEYDFGETFDVILCVYDSINHLQTWEQWSAVFANARKHLTNGGVFILDFNTIERLKWLTDNPPFGREIGDDYMFMKIWDRGNQFDWDIRIFEKQSDEHFILHKDVIHEASFPLKQVLSEVEKSFEIMKVVDRNGLDEKNPNWRPFVVCRKR